MPELPEVETIRRDLVGELVGRRISGADVRWARTVQGLPAGEFAGFVSGRTITGIRRRGKYLIFDLSGDRLMIIHLRMSGALYLQSSSPVPTGKGDYVRAVLQIDDGRYLVFSDQRKFGRIYPVADELTVIGDLGPEPLEEGFTPDFLAGVLAGREAPVKAVLVEQGLIAGIGNMYADEALFAARIHPCRPAAGLSADEVKRLHAAIRLVLNDGIESCGASVNTYRRPDGSPGWAHTHFKVAHRNGDCLVCGHAIERTTVRGRGTYFCPQCQPAGR